MILPGDTHCTLEILNRQRLIRPGISRLARLFQAALPLCQKCIGPAEVVLPNLQCITTVLVSDRRIAQIHRQFMNVPGPTDVITFHQGDIIISAHTAAREAEARELRIEDEIALYFVHGLLHLNGHEDATEQGHRTMHRLQHRIWRRILDACVERE